TITSVLAGTNVAEDPPEIRTPVVLEDPAELLAGTEPRERVSQPHFSPVAGECRSDVPKDSINLDIAELLRPNLGQFQPPNIFNDIMVNKLSEDFKVIVPVHFACKTLHINDLRRDSAV